jgi:hypothetical protein
MLSQKAITGLYNAENLDGWETLLNLSVLRIHVKG